MNITAGNPLERGKYLDEIDTRAFIVKLMEKSFSGYICVAIQGKMGLEEGTVVLHNGAIVSSDYEYFYYNKTFKADSGLERSLNALRAPIGVVDAFSLSAYQVQLILTLNEENNLKKSVTTEDLIVPAAFSFNYEEELGEEVPEEEVTREQMLKRLGLTRLVGAGATRTALIKKAKEEAKKTSEGE